MVKRLEGRFFIAPRIRVAKDDGKLGQSFNLRLELVKSGVYRSTQLNQDINVVGSRWYLVTCDKKSLEVFLGCLLTEESRLVGKVCSLSVSNRAAARSLSALRIHSSASVPAFIKHPPLLEDLTQKEIPLLQSSL